MRVIVKITKQILLAGALVFCSTSAFPLVEDRVTFSTPGTYSWPVPFGVRSIKIDACAAGAGGGGGNNAVAPGAGGSGGGAGQWSEGYEIEVHYPQILTVTIPAAGAGGAVASNGTAGGDLTITGGDTNFPLLGGGSPGKGASGLNITLGGDGGGKRGVGGLGVGTTAVGVRNSKPYFGFPHNGGGGAGGNGGGLDPFGAHPAVAANDGQSEGSFTSDGAGTGAQAGGGGGASPYGSGGAGGNTSPATAGAAPSLGFCGGGGGGGPDSVVGTGGDGSPGWSRFRYSKI